MLCAYRIVCSLYSFPADTYAFSVFLFPTLTILLCLGDGVEMEFAVCLQNRVFPAQLPFSVFLFSPFFYLSHGLCSYFNYTLVFRGQGVDGMSCVFSGNTSAFSVSLYLSPFFY